MNHADAAQDRTGTAGLAATGLAPGTRLLSGQYVIQRPLQSGGFGITYQATDSLERQVVVKECFPGELCTRHGDAVRPLSSKGAAAFTALRAQFVREARQMAKLLHPNIVAVHQVFEENNTAYMALDEIHGTDLVALREKHLSRITKSFVKAVFDQSLEVLDYLHGKGLLHRDISPDNLMVDGQNKLTLIDFGAARESSGAEQETLYAVKDGYSPPELYVTGRRQSFPCDIYALGATLHYLITGEAPPDCITRMRAIDKGQDDPYAPLAQGVWPHDHNLLASIDRALKLVPSDRYQSVAAWRKAYEKLPTERPRRAASAAFGPKSEAEIAQLVATTNAQLSGIKSGPATAGMTQQTEPPRTAQSRRPVVDIFGNPITDLDAWQAEQDALARARRTDLLQDQPEAHRPEPRRASLLSTLVARLFRPTKTTLKSTP